MTGDLEKWFGKANITEITFRVPTESLKWYNEAMADYKREMEYDLALHVITVGTMHKCAQQYENMKNEPKDICPAFMT